MSKLYSIKDTKIGFNQPFVAPNNMAAIRMFGDTCTDQKSSLAQHPEDYELYFLGEMDDDTGEIKSKTSYLERATTFASK